MIGALGRARLATNVAALSAGGVGELVAPVTDWRIQPAAVVVTGSSADAANQTAILASKANKSFPSIQVGSNTTCYVVMDLPDIAAPGGLLFVSTRSGSTAQRSIGLESSTDGGATWAPVPFTPLQTQSADNTDQLIDIPAATARKYRLRYQTLAAVTQAFAFKVVQLQADARANDIWAAVSMSIGAQNNQSGILTSDAVTRFAGRDPIFVSVARAGATPATMLTEQLVKLVQPRPYIKRVIMDMGPNNYLQQGRWADISQAVRDGFIADAQAVASWFSANDRIPSYVGPTFVDPANFDAGGATNVLQENVVDGPSVSIANQVNGVRPHIMNAYAPLAKLVTGAWNAKFDAYAFDGYGPSLLSWDFWKQLVSGMTPGDGVHPLGLAGAMYRIAFFDAYAASFGAAPRHYVERKVDAAEPFTSLAQKNRLYLGVASMPDTADTAALAARAALKDRIDAIGTVYVEKAGQTSPAALPGIKAAFDFDDMNTLWSDDAATIAAKDRELIRRVSDKSANAYKLVNAVSAAGPPYRQPQVWMGEAAGEKSIFMDSTMYLETTDAGLFGALDAAAQPFIVGWIDAPAARALATGTAILWQLVGTGALNVRFGSGTSRVSLVTTAVLGTEAVDAVLNVQHVYVLTYDGTTLKLIRDGVETISVAWAKPAWTATNLRMGAASGGLDGRRKSWSLVTGAWSAATRDALQARLMAQAGAG